MARRNRAPGEPRPLPATTSVDLVDLVGGLTAPSVTKPNGDALVDRDTANAGASAPSADPADRRPAIADAHMGGYVPLTLPGGPSPGWRHARSERPTQAPANPLVVFGEYVRRSRYLVDMSQERLGHDSGVSQSMISRLERALAPGMRVDALVLLGEQLGHAFPLGFCPHDHRCTWQRRHEPNPDPESEQAARRRELLIELGLDHPYGKRFGDD